MKIKKIFSASLIGLTMAAFTPMFGLIAFALSLFGGNISANNFIGLFDPTGLTLKDEGIKAASELIYQEKFMSPDWKTFAAVESGIKHNKQLVILGNFNGLAGSVRGACDITANPGNLTSQEKTWTPAYISDRFEECYSDVQAMFWKWLLANGLDKENLDGSVYTDFLLYRLSQYMSDDMFYRLMFFTDTAHGVGVTNNLTPDQLEYFTPFSGVFKQCETIIAATAARRITIGAENTNATKATQVFAAASPTVQPATDYLNSLFYNASLELRSAPNNVILTTQSIADQYAQERTKLTGIPLAYDRTETGQKTFSFQGVPVIPLFTWDRLIRRHYDNGAKYLNPHRALFTTKDNIRVGTEEVNNFTDLRSEYNTYHKKWFAEFGFNMDVKIVDDNLIQYAY